MGSPLSRRSLRLPALLLAVACAVAGLLAHGRLSQERFRAASDRLELLRTLRKGALEAYFDTLRAELTFWSINDGLRGRLSQLREGWDGIPGDRMERLQKGYLHENPFPRERRRELLAVEDGSAYADAHRGIHGLAAAFVVERGYYDFFLLDPEGNVIYTVEKEDDFAANLHDGPLRDSGLARVHLRALQEAGRAEAPRVVFSDFERYGPSNDAPALFAGLPVLSSDGGLLGVLAVQVPTQRIQDIMQFTEGMGRSGETYLVGRDLLMRSDSRFEERSTTLELRVESETVQRALAGETGVAITDDYRGIPVLSAYERFTLDDFEWAVMAEIDRDEVAESLAGARVSIPLAGLGFYALSLLSLWFVGGASRSELGDFADLDLGDPPSP